MLRSPMTNPDLQLRPFELADAQLVAPWLLSPGLSVPRGTASWSERLVRDQRIHAMIAHLGGRPVGLVRLDFGPDGVAEITVVVAPEHRRSGRGRRMFEQALDHARALGVCRLLAYVDLTNVAALEFFAGVGFESRGVTGSRIRMDRLVHQGGRLPPLDVGV